MEPQHRIVWITGASSGIGRSLAESFVRHGDTAIATARQEDKLRELQHGVAGTSGHCVAHACDIRREEEVQAVAGAILKEFGRVDILINCAGVTYFKDFLTTTADEFDNVVDTNLKGVFYATRAVLPSMLERADGTIVNVISYAAKVAYTLSSAYAASKAGVEALMDGLRAEVRDKGIKVINVFPGAVSTPMWHPKHRERYAECMMKPEEIAEFLFTLTRQPKSMMVEDVVIRPQAGDLKV